MAALVPSAGTYSRDRFFGLGHRYTPTSGHTAFDAVGDLFQLLRGRKNHESTCFDDNGPVFLGGSTALPQSGFAQGNPLIGTWKINLTKSKYSPGPPPTSGTTIFEAVGPGIKITADGIDAQGNPAKAVIMNFNDAKSHPVTGVPAYDSESDKEVNDSTWWIIRKKAGKVVQTLIGEVTPDGKIWTVTIAGVNPNGQQIYNVIVREKQ